jgi:hypothetical protein
MCSFNDSSHIVLQTERNGFADESQRLVRAWMDGNAIARDCLVRHTLAKNWTASTIHTLGSHPNALADIAWIGMVFVVLTKRHAVGDTSV